MRPTIGLRFGLFFASAIAAVAIVTFGTVTWFASRHTEEQAKRAVATAATVLGQMLPERGEALAARCRMLAEGPGLGPLILSGDASTADDYLRDNLGVLDGSGAVLLDSRGATVGSSDPTRYRDWHPDGRLPSDIEALGIVEVRGLAEVGVSVPIIDPVTRARQGTLVAFKRIDDELARELAGMIGADVFLSYMGRRIASCHGHHGPDLLIENQMVRMRDGTTPLLVGVGFPRSRLFAGLDAQRAVLAILFLTLLTVGCVLAYQFSRTFTRPVESVIEAGRLLRQGVWPEPIRVTRDDELGMLQSVFNEMTETLSNNQKVSIQALAATVDARDKYTAGHSDRVAAQARRLAHSLGLPMLAVERIHTVGTLHDIGKLSLPDAILLKEGLLSSEERLQMQEHPVRSEEIVRTIPSLLDTLPGIRHHHERWDGRGYPDGLLGEDIPLEARIVAIADAFDALTTDRPYRPSRSIEAALEVLVLESGRQFDPRLVRAFLNLWPSGTAASIT